MAIKTNTKKVAENHEIKVIRARAFDNGGVVFDVEVNGVTIHGMNVVTKKDGGQFFSFPSYKGKDGKYYSYVYVNFTAEDNQKIEDGINALL